MKPKSFLCAVAVLSLMSLAMFLTIGWHLVKNPEPIAHHLSSKLGKTRSAARSLCERA